MRTRILIVAIAAALLSTGAAFAASANGHGKIRYSFLGQLTATPSNCVQCGAITAKGGRLTPPEGGSGPEYTVT